MLANPPSLLITDDDRAFRETLQEVFEPEGYQTLLAEDGERACQIVQNHLVHLLLVDMHMPRLSGIETLRRIHRIHPRLPCILLSAELDETIVRQAREESAFSVLPKPVSRQHITDIVRSALARHYRNLPLDPPKD